MLTSNQRDIVAMIILLYPTMERKWIIENYEWVRKELESEEQNESNTSSGDR